MKLKERCINEGLDDEKKVSSMNSAKLSGEEGKSKKNSCSANLGKTKKANRKLQRRTRGGKHSQKGKKGRGSCLGFNL